MKRNVRFFSQNKLKTIIIKQYRKHLNFTKDIFQHKTIRSIFRMCFTVLLIGLVLILIRLNISMSATPTFTKLIIN
jgi:hypothetical protein